MPRFHFPATAMLAIMLITSWSGNSACQSAELTELPYNHPGLKVDLGVGLWAWPMPMDYDGDGDLDLLVACPDKPSNGVYFFENPTQDPSEKLPVFKPAVRLGPASQNMQVSYVNGQPHVLKNGYEYPRDATTGVFNFDKPNKIYPTNNVHANKTRGNMWRYVDYDGDGDQDLVIGAGDWTDYGWDHAYDSSGRWHNGPLHGYVYWINNEGSSEQPKYSKNPQRVKAAGGDIDVYGWPSPNFADFDGDGDLDLLCGEFMDGFTYFENVGSRTEPDYAAGQKLINSSGEPLVMHLQMITPTAIDWDGDKDLDLIVGDEDGRVALVENTGEFRDQRPVFHAPVYFQQQADTLKFGALATPFAVDFDGDGDQDILCGNTAGNIGYFENLGDGENGLPKWSAPSLIEVKTADGKSTQPFRVMAGPSGSIQGPCEAKWGYTTLSVADWDGDGDLDIIYNSILSRLEWLRNDDGVFVIADMTTPPGEEPPAWYWWQTESPESITQWRTTPLAIDFDGDQKLDLVMLDQQGYLTLRRSGQNAERIFVAADGQPLQLNPKSCGGSGRIKLAVVDWDQDGRLDVLVNSENASWYRNCGDFDGKILLKKIGNLAKRNVAGHTSSPSACDLNRDGKPDLMVGAENGRIYYIAHDDCETFDEQQLNGTITEQPESRMPGLVHDEFVFTKPPTKECHASTVCQTSRGLVAAWFAGTKEKNEDVGIWTSYHDGAGWTSPQQVATGVQHSELRYPCWNPVLYQPPGDAPLILFFKTGPDPQSWWGEMMVSYDRGRTFRDRRRLPTGIDGPVRCKPILLDDGTLLCGSSTENDGWRVHFEKVALVGGQPEGTWNRIGPINDATDFNAIQPTIMRGKDGSLIALCRTKEGVIASTSSRDNGQSWSALQATKLPNPNSGIDAVTLQDGRQLLIYNHLDSGKTGWGRRGMLNLAMSEDDGQTWQRVGVLEQEQGAEFSYPAIVQSDDGLIHATYTWKRQRVKHVVLDPNGLKVETGSN
ncbi:exo-alpha-sialidase [Stieleria varia]|uniref:FG-GAP repeat protein n=1 Tax=Stieleria varia TaxID=2528005 RepID=A0A5C6B7X1_9BACT|nr:exo-alpha-sialidase [Stieleria varia]TWU07907.1 FG-GAP repeat protein [Stieleria varia]